MEWKREPDENERIVRSHTARAPWLRDTVTQQDTEMRRLRQLRLVATYGIGGCSRILLSPRQSDAWADLARGSKVSDTERAWIESFLKVAIPNAYRRVMHGILPRRAQRPRHRTETDRVEEEAMPREGRRGQGDHEPRPGEHPADEQHSPPQVENRQEPG
jgi:hypothetical protein